MIAPCGWVAFATGGVPPAWDGMVVLALVTFAAAAINAIAGGGTILTFPCLTAILPDAPARLVTANATSTLGLWPGALTAAWASRGKRDGVPAWTRVLLPVSVVGAVVGTALVLLLPPRWFAGAVPWLILAAAVLFALQPRLASLVGAAPTPAADESPTISSASAGPRPTTPSRGPSASGRRGTRARAHSACAISTRSNGSRWSGGSPEKWVITPSSIGRPVIPWAIRWVGK